VGEDCEAKVSNERFLLVFVMSFVSCSFCNNTVASTFLIDKFWIRGEVETGVGKR
ncbi:MAG: hypothetical protein ACI8RD_003433, partial [Bacillariaceae sp.]|jgi:hypothetical protein